MSLKCSQLQISPVPQADIFRIFLGSISGHSMDIWECPTTREKGNVNRRKALYQDKKYNQSEPVFYAFLYDSKRLILIKLHAYWFTATISLSSQSLSLFPSHLFQHLTTNIPCANWSENKQNNT